MQIKAVNNIPGWYHILETSNVYTADREALDENIVYIDEVPFISDAGMRNIRSSRGASNVKLEIVSRPEEFDYSNQVFLTNTEFHNFVVQKVDEFCRTSDEDISWYLKNNSMFGNDVSIYIVKNTSVSYTGNIYTDQKAMMDSIDSINLKEVEKNVFDSENDKNVFLNEFLKEAFEILNRKLENHNNSEKDN